MVADCDAGGPQSFSVELDAMEDNAVVGDAVVVTFDVADSDGKCFKA